MTGPISDFYHGSSEEGDSPTPQPHMALSHYLSQPHCSPVGHHPHVSVHKSHINPEPPVPLLLHPDIMPSTPVQFVTSQVSKTACPGTGLGFGARVVYKPTGFWVTHTTCFYRIPGDCCILCKVAGYTCIICLHVGTV